MHIYAIGDLHLSGQPPVKPMELFGEQWRGHWEKITANWQEQVKTEDAVLLCGDLSYGGRFDFLQNTCIDLGVAWVGGTRGWLLPSAEGFTEEDAKIYAREGIRLELSLAAAKRRGEQPLIAALHYPPLYDEKDENIFTQLLEKYGVACCVFGHIHSGGACSAFQGERRGIVYKLVSCDTMDFKLYRVL